MKLPLIVSIAGVLVILGGVLYAAEDKYNQEDSVHDLLVSQKLTNIALQQHVSKNLGRLIINLESIESPSQEERRELLLHKDSQEDVKAILFGLYSKN